MNVHAAALIANSLRAEGDAQRARAARSGDAGAAQRLARAISARGTERGVGGGTGEGRALGHAELKRLRSTLLAALTDRPRR